MDFSSLQVKVQSLLQGIRREIIEILFHTFFHFKKWASLEKDLTPEEKSIKRSFFISSFIMGGIMFFMTSISSAIEKEDVNFWPKSEISDYEAQNTSLAEEGFFAKTNTPTYSAIDRSSVASIVKYEVQAGDTLEMIANRFGINISTIINNNTIENPSSLSSGLILKILPVDGVLYEVESGDTLGSIASKYELDLEALEKQNQRGGKVRLIAGSYIILPGVEIIHEEPTPTPAIIAENKKNTPAPTPKKKLAIVKSKPTTQKQSAKIVASAKKGKRYIWPVAGGGSVTQGYHYGHYAIDVWGSNKPGIIAIASGTVIKSSAGCGAFQRTCNGGYGNVIIIDHGNGVTSLYAHNTALYVSKGDKVSAGQLIAKMGNSGNVYGKTGVHLHFELSISGRKVNPLSYL